MGSGLNHLKADWRMDAELPAVMWLVYHWFHLENVLQLALISGCHLKCHYLLTVCRAQREYELLPAYLEKEDFLCLIKDRTNQQAACVKKQQQNTRGQRGSEPSVPQLERWLERVVFWIATNRLLWIQIWWKKRVLTIELIGCGWLLESGRRYASTQ